MYYVYCSDPDHTFVGETRDPEEAVRMSREHQAPDGHGGFYACYIWQDGDIVGNCVDGIHGKLPEGSPPYDHATATGMYDRY
jgi:hypothetical protein